MKINKVKCDHCGKEPPHIMENTYIVIGAAYNYTKVNLCEDCLEELWKIIDTFCNTAKEGEKSERV